MRDVIEDYIRQGGELFMRLRGRYDELNGLDHARAVRTVPAMIQAIMDQWSFPSLWLVRSGRAVPC